MLIQLSPSSGMPPVSVHTPLGASDRGEVVCECGCGRRFAHKPRKRFAGAPCRVRWHRQMRDERDDQIARMIRALYDAAVGSRE